MARYLVATGNWTSTSVWGTTDGGSPGAAVPTSSDDVFLTATSGAAALTVSSGVSCKSITCTGFTGSFTHSNTIIVAGSVLLVAGMTYTGTGAWNLNGAGTNTFTTGGQLIPPVQLTNGNLTLGDSLNFIASKTVACTITVGHALNLNGFTISGNSRINQALIQSNTVGTQVSVTRSTGTFANTDFMDITVTDAWNASARTDIGDCGGNSGITFPAGATQAWNGTSGGNVSTNAWTSRVPLPQDPATFNTAFSAAQTVTFDMPRMGSVNFTGATGTPTLANTTACTLFGSYTGISGMTMSGTSGFTLGGRSSSTITSAGKTFGGKLTINAPNGTYTLQDALVTSSSAAGALTVTNGTLADNGFSVSLTGANSTFVMTGGTLNHTGAWSLGGTATASIWSVTGGTVNSTGTITMTNTSTNTRTFAGGGKTYGTLTYTVAGSTGGLTLTGATTLAAINVSDASNARTLTLPAGVTTTITAPGGFNVNGTSGKLMTVNSSSSGTQATLSHAGIDIENCDYLSLKDNAATGGASWNAGHNSTFVSNVTGWGSGTGFLGSLASTIAHTAAMSRTYAAQRNLSSSIAHTTSITKSRGQTRNVASTIAHTTAISRAQAVTRLISSTIAHTVAITRLQAFGRLIASSIPHTAAISRVKATARLIASSIPHTTAISRSQAVLRAISSTIPHTTTIARSLGPARYISSVIPHVVSMSRQVGAVRTISSSISHTVTIVGQRFQAIGLRQAYTTLPRTTLYQSALRLVRWLGVGSKSTGGVQMLAKAVGQGTAFLGVKEKNQPYAGQLQADRFGPGEVVISADITVEMTTSGSVAKTTVATTDTPNGFLISQSLCGSVTAVVIDDAGTGCDATTKAVIGQPNYPGMPASVQTVVGGAALSAINVLPDPLTGVTGGFAYITAPAVNFQGAGSGMAAHAVVPMTGVVVVLGNANAVAGARYFVTAVFTLNSGREEQLEIPPFPGQDYVQ